MFKFAGIRTDGANRARGGSITLLPELIAWYEQQFDRWVRGTLDCHEELEPHPRSGPKGCEERRTVHHLALRASGLQDGDVSLLHDLGMPFTNDQAEQDLLKMKLRIKISGGFRPEWRCQDFATLHGRRAGKQYRNRFETLLRGRPCCAASGGRPGVPSAYHARSALGVRLPHGFGLRARQIRRNYLGSYESCSLSVGITARFGSHDDV